MDFSKVELPDHLVAPDPELYEYGKYLVLDYETTNYQKGSAQYQENDIVLACWEDGGEDPDQYYKFGGCYEQADLQRAVERVDFIVAHNAKFELQWLARSGVDISNLIVFDTMIAEYVLGGNRWQHRALSLSSCLERRGMPNKSDLIGLMLKNKICPSSMPQSWLLEYGLTDVRVTGALFHEQLRQLRERDLLPVMFTRCLATPVLADIECNGMQLDPERIVEKTEEMERSYIAAQEELEGVTGGINISSPRQLVPYLYEKLGFKERRDRRGNAMRTKGGAPLTDQETIGQLKPTNAAQSEFLRLYTLNKSMYNELTKYLRKFVECCNKSGGLLRASFNQCATRTHRLSSSGLDYNCQFQNFPRSYKPLFKARHEGWEVGEGDGAQLEFRVAAHLGRDDTALSDIKNKVDIHSFTAGVIGCSRQEAKADTFKPLYGGQSGTPRQQAYYKAFKEKYDGIARTQEQWISTVLANKVLRTEWSMRYYWPDTKMERSGYVKNRTSICNYPVQALATAEIIPVALVYFYHYVKALGLQMFIVNTVHDSIICELPPEEREMFHLLCRQCLIHEPRQYLKKVYYLDFVAPLGAGVKTGTHWSEGKETVYED